MNDLIVLEPGENVFLVFFNSSHLISVLKQQIASFISVSLKLNRVKLLKKTLGICLSAFI